MRTSPGDIRVHTHTPACLPTGRRENTHFCAASGVKSGFYPCTWRQIQIQISAQLLPLLLPKGAWQSRDQQETRSWTSSSMQGKAGAELHGRTCPFFSFDNPPVNVVGRPKVRATFGSAARAEICHSPLSPSRLEENNKRIEG